MVGNVEEDANSLSIIKDESLRVINFLVQLQSVRSMVNLKCPSNL